MDFENRQVEEGINVSSEHPLKEFAYLSVSIIIVLSVLFLFLSLSVDTLIKFTPFKAEVWLADKISNQFIDDNEANDERAAQVTQYLQKVADKLRKNQHLDKKMTITVHYINEPIINAFATLGGHVFIYQGLLDILKSENALAMVLAHEIAHVKYRHPLVAFGRQVSFGLVLSLMGFSDNGVSAGLGDQLSLFTSLAFSRKQELKADEDAYATLVKTYGYGKGASEFFITLNNKESPILQAEIFSSHPLNEKRIQKLQQLEQLSLIKCNTKESCPMIPLPNYIVVIEP